MTGMEAPRDNLIREAPFEIIRADAPGDGLTMEGYAAVFNTPTVIDSWEGNFRETIQPGAFRKSLRERTPVLMFEHGQHPLIGSMPLGVITKAREDSHGVLVEARLSDNWMIQPVRDAIAAGAISGMSFRMRVLKEEWTAPKKEGQLPERVIQEVSVPELGPVVFPAYKTTTVGVRSEELVDLLTDPEIRADLARAIFRARLPQSLDATLDGAADLGTPEGAGEDLEPLTHSSRNIRRHRALAAMARLKECISEQERRTA